MRIITFKAKSIDGGEWVEGDLVHAIGGTFIQRKDKGITYIKQKSIGHHTIVFDEDIILVDPATVCQFTGLLDSKGVRIFEGDKIHYYSAKYWEQRSFPEYIDCAGYNVKKEEDTVIWAEDGWWGITSRTIDGVDYNWLSSCFCKCEQDADEVDGDEELVGTVTVTGNIHDSEATK